MIKCRKIPRVASDTNQTHPRSFAANVCACTRWAQVSQIKRTRRWCRSDRCAPTPAERLTLNSESFDQLKVCHARLLPWHAGVYAQWDRKAGRTGDHMDWGRWAQTKWTKCGSRTCGADMLLEAHLDDSLTGEWAYPQHTTTASLCVCARQSLQPLCRVNRCVFDFFSKRKFLWHLCRWRCLTSCWSFVYLFCGQRRFKRICN